MNLHSSNKEIIINVLNPNASLVCYSACLGRTSTAQFKGVYSSPYVFAPSDTQIALFGGQVERLES